MGLVRTQTYSHASEIAVDPPGDLVSKLTTRDWPAELGPVHGVNLPFHCQHTTRRSAYVVVHLA